MGYLLLDGIGLSMGSTIDRLIHHENSNKLPIKLGLTDELHVETGWQSQGQ